MNERAQVGLEKIYQQMFRAKQIGDDKLADKLMIQMEELRSEQGKPDSASVAAVLHLLPSFAKETLGKSQSELGRSERSNCINASFNFHASDPRWPTYTTMEFLDRIQSDFVQIAETEPVQCGDLIVLWSRTGGTWDNRKIEVHQIEKSDSDFPYGLVFDHIVVQLTDDLVFHKPDPTLESRYQIEYLSSVVTPTIASRGFEITRHRRVGRK